MISVVKKKTYLMYLKANIL